MKHVRKIFAFALTLVMAFAIALPAFAEDGNQGGAASTTPVGRTIDPKVMVTGLGENDTVTAYQFITWNDDDGWVLDADITGIELADITGPDGAVELTAAQLGTLASQTDNLAQVTTGSKNGTTWEMTCGTLETVGSYLILVTSGAAEYIYNPVVVSADFNGENGTVNLTESAAAIKKQNITVKKEADNGADDYSVQFGDIVPFTVTVTVPQYNTNWTEPYFAVSDTLSTGLTIEDGPTIKGLTDGTDYTLTKGAKGDDGFTITFDESYLKENASAALEIKYSAKVGEVVEDTAQVHHETNKVTLEFSNNPSNSSDHKTIDDETHHYTFAIDATRKGQGSEKTNELIKVGVDANGDPVTVYEEGEELPTGVQPLAGAEFTLTGIGANGGTGENGYSQTATSDADGRIFFNNLEVGTYTLQETKAPNGYIKDQDPHTVVITAEYNDDTKLLESYTIKIDNQATSTYTATTDAENVTITAATGNLSFPIENWQGTELPSTGGIGTTIFYVVGGVMVAGAAIFLLTKRRMSGNVQ